VKAVKGVKALLDIRWSLC